MHLLYEAGNKKLRVCFTGFYSRGKPLHCPGGFPPLQKSFCGGFDHEVSATSAPYTNFMVRHIPNYGDDAWEEN